MMLCISTTKRMLAHAFAWSKMIKNIWKWVKKNLFHHAHGLQRKTKKKVCWSAIGSDSQKLVDTLKLVAHLEFCCFCTFFYMSNACELCKCSLKNYSFFFVFLREPYVSLSCAWWKRSFLHDFQMFLITFDHVKACAACVCWSKYTTSRWHFKDLLYTLLCFYGVNNSKRNFNFLTLPE